MRTLQAVFDLATELADALEKSVQGEAVELQLTLNNCMAIFPDLFSPGSTQNPKGSLTREINDGIPKHISCWQLDANKIKYDLYQGSAKSKLLLLQALRWQITKNRSGEREQTVTWLARQDILGLKNAQIKSLLSTEIKPHPLQQAVARLINAIVSLSVGRDYITSSEEMVSLLIETAKKGNIDKNTEDMITAIMQKLSLRKQVCKIMINNGMVEWVVNKLNEGTAIQRYSLDYLTSLLMNLSIHVNLSYWDNCPGVATNLIGMMFTSHREAIEFICGTLYNILRNEIMNNFCKAEDISTKLSECYKKFQGDTLLMKQIETLIKLHKREIKPETLELHQTQYCEDELEDPEKIEPEIDENDLVKGSPNGRELLEMHYRLIFSTPSVVGRSLEKDNLVFQQSSNSILPSWAVKM